MSLKSNEQLLAEYEPRSLGVIEPDRHLSAIRHSPCGQILAAPAFDQTIRRWDLRGGGFPPIEMNPVEGHNGYASAVAFHPTRRLAYSADTWGAVQAWPYLDETPEPVWRVEQAHNGWIRDIAISPDGDWLATCGRDQFVRLISTADGQAREFTGHEEDIFALGVHPSGRWVVSGDLRGRLIQWDVTTGQITREFDGSDFYHLDRIQDLPGIRRIFFDADGSTLLIAGTIPTGGGFFRGRAHVRLIDFDSGNVRHDVALGEEKKDIFAHDVCLHPEGFLIACTSGQAGAGKLILQRPGDETSLFTNSKGTINCHSLSLSPDGQQLLVSATNSGSGGNGQRLDKEGKYAGNFSPIHCFALGPSEPKKAGSGGPTE